MSAFGPYSPIRKAGNTYYVSGQVGVDIANKTAPKGCAEQTSQALSNLQDVLASEGLQLDNVVKTTVYLADMADFAAMNSVYEGFFSAPRPARTTVAVKELPRLANNPLLVEIEAVAVQP